MRVRRFYVEKHRSMRHTHRKISEELRRRLTMWDTGDYYGSLQKPYIRKALNA